MCACALRAVQATFLLLHVTLILTFAFGRHKSLFPFQWLSMSIVVLAGVILVVGHLFHVTPVGTWWDDVGIQIGFVRLPQVGRRTASV